MPISMGNSRLFAIIIIVTSLFLIGGNLGFVDAKGKEVKVLILDALNKQVLAWNRGDLDSFMASYLNSPDISYTSSGKVVWGYQALKLRYEEKYGVDQSAMGQLSFANLKVKELGDKNALCIGQWNLIRDKEKQIQGVYSLVLTKTKAGWKIVHDHTSVLPSDP